MSLTCFVNPTTRLEVRVVLVVTLSCFVLSAWYTGECWPFFEDGVCGEDVLGERLYVGPDGNGTCDCDEVSPRSSSPLTKSHSTTRVGSDTRTGVTRSSAQLSVVMARY